MQVNIYFFQMWIFIVLEGYPNHDILCIMYLYHYMIILASVTAWFLFMNAYKNHKNNQW